MTQWEYCRVEWKVSPISSDEEKRDLQEHGFKGKILEGEEVTLAAFGYLKFLGSSQEPEEITNPDHAMAQLGRDGWELVSHTEITSPTEMEVFYFKRQLLQHG
jgi:hypothetical protein